MKMSKHGFKNKKKLKSPKNAYFQSRRNTFVTIEKDRPS